ncbi:MAG TPA: hypothetical protein VHA56_17500 [Mucilaginibacter sp.]|nr:hypothetical protein [Mucilaginibacter sp.]
MIKRLWHSPTLMTWMSYSTKALTLFGVLPMVLKNFLPQDIVLWYMFSTVISIQNLADFGFRQTFSRIISFAFGGAKDIGIFNQNQPNTPPVDAEPNLNLLTNIVSTMRTIYIWLTLLVLAVGGIFGTWAMVIPVGNASNEREGWISWGIVLLVSCISFYGKIYLNFLEGLYKIALVRRVESLTSIGSILSSITVLYFSPTLLHLVIVNQFWVIVVTLRDWYLCTHVDKRFYLKVSEKRKFDKVIFLKIWKPAWRTGVSSLMSVGLTNITGLIYAQIGTSAVVASYLLAIRIINQIKEVSMAPFYSKLPLLARLRVKNDVKSLITVSKRGMLLSNLAYTIGFIIVGLFSDYILRTIHSEVRFVNQPLWILLGFAFFVHRYGAMHMQIYLSTNHIISHIADGISGVLYVLSTIILSKYIGVYAIPVGMLVGYLCFYAWYAAKHSIKSLGVNLLSFEVGASLTPFIMMVIYIFYQIKSF